MTIVTRWMGGVTDTRVAVMCRPSVSSVDVIANVFEFPVVAGAVDTSGTKTADDEPTGGVVVFGHSDFSGTLTADTEYEVRFSEDGTPDTTNVLRFRTMPTAGQAASFKFCFASCHDGSQTIDDVYTRIVDQSPLFFVHMGDFHYEATSSSNVEDFATEMKIVIERAVAEAFFHTIPMVYMWSDHDYGDNNAGGSNPAKAAAQEAYRLMVPTYPLVLGSGAPYYSFSVGRIRFVMTDPRSFKDPVGDTDNSSKTCLGTVQKQWWKDELLAAFNAGEAVIWNTEMPFCSDVVGDDDWSRYKTERTELMDYVQSIEMGTRLATINGDEHTLAADDGTNTASYVTSGSMPIPVMVAAALRNNASLRGGPYSQGSNGGPGQYGLMEITDTGGSTIGVVYSGKDTDDATAISLSFNFVMSAGGPGGDPATGGALLLHIMRTAL